MFQKYFERAEELMEISNSCDDLEIANILKVGAGKIFELAQSNGAILKTATIKDVDKDIE